MAGMEYTLPFPPNRQQPDVLQATFIVHLLSLLSFANAFFTFHRTRPYRLFEAPIDDVPSTPSARRVAVDSSPTTSSPLRVISTLLPSAASSAWKRAHPDPTKDVWELSVWDPLPICLRTFCLFSPGHVLVYWLFLPALPTDPRPSVTVFTALLLGALLSAQLSLLQGAFERRAKDNAVVSKEVLHEYDTKFVHPHTHRMARDVGTQFSTPPDQQPPKRRSADGVVVGTNRVEIYKPRLSGSATTFRNLSNPNYTAWVDPDGGGYTETPPRRPQHPPPTRSAATGTAQQPGSALRPLPTPSRDLTSPLLQRSSAAQARQPYRASTGMGDGGSLGVYSHAHSPLKKAASTHFVPGRGLGQVQGGNRRESGRF